MDRDFWQELYRTGDTRFDLGAASPPLVDWLDAHAKLPAGRAIVPGCGKGHDAIELARRGFRAVGVDFAPGAVAEARRLAQAAGQGEHATFLEEDVFALGPAHDGAYDLLFEMACYCAIDPKRRDEYARLAARLVAPGGRLLFVVFPVDGRTGGPPFAIGAQEVQLRFADAFDVEFFGEPARASAPARAGKERFAVLRRKR